MATAIREAADREIGGLEIWIEDLWRQEETPGYLADLARELGIALSACAPRQDVNMLSPNAEERERSMRWTVEAVAVARQLGAPVLTIDPGRLVGADQTLGSGWRPLISAARTIAQAAENQGVRVALENPAPASDRVLTHLVDAQSLLREVNSPFLGISLNLSHLGASAEDAVDWVGGIDRVFQIRVSPGRPRRTLQLLLGRADQRALFVDRLEAAQFQGQVVLDDAVLGHDPDRLADALAQIRRWFIVRRPTTARRAALARARGSGNSA
ncbi:MAG TPA: sugar phosphate isomerase/epimerase family protein [Dehalococcoidia bacterium]|nr:sugar phosphate isomerase/epimerase family protein [Dehalococcoidia bacterium]